MRALATSTATALLLLGTLAGCGDSTDTPSTVPTPSAEATLPADTTVVRVAGMAFTPATVTIRVGQSVTWQFDDNAIPHNVTGTGAAATELKSPILATGTYTKQFDTPGTYAYECTLHPNMTGTVVVTD
ncbi:cupredoxin domain-containing protein [Rhodococcus sp. NPDC003322]